MDKNKWSFIISPVYILMMVACGVSSSSSSSDHTITGNYTVSGVRCVFGDNGMFCADNNDFWYTTNAVSLPASGGSVDYFVTDGTSSTAHTLTFSAVSSGTPDTISITNSFDNITYNFVRNGFSDQDVDPVATYSDGDLTYTVDSNLDVSVSTTAVTSCVNATGSMRKVSNNYYSMSLTCSSTTYSGYASLFDETTDRMVFLADNNGIYIFGDTPAIVP